MPADREFLTMAKPLSARCNLRCAYCYYLGREQLFAPGLHRMAEPLLERYIEQYLHASPGPVTHFEWHGGEPTLLGVSWFRRVRELQRKHCPPDRTLTNGLQTNGTLLDAEWAAFLADEGFSVGLSIDGPADLHDAFRVDAAGRPTHRDVLRAWKVLERRRVETSVLCVLHAVNAGSPTRVYEFFKEMGASSIQFLPLVERAPEAARGVSPRTASPEQVGAFFCDVFDDWVRHDVGRVVIQLFDEALRVCAGLPHALCIFRETCGDVLVVEHDGSVFPCDHFVDAGHRLPSLVDADLEEVLRQPALVSFGRAKRDALPDECRTCDVLRWCNGGCPKDRLPRGSDGAPGRSHLCGAYRRFFRHARPALERLAAHWGSGRPLDEFPRLERRPAVRDLRAGPNDPCPCGSGRKFKRCCRA